MNISKLLFYILLYVSVFLIACNSDELDEIDPILINDNSSRDNSGNDDIVDFYGSNILKNGGLEKWNSLLSNYYDIPTDWGCHNNSNVKKNMKIVCEGNYSARMSSLKTGSTARIDQNVPVTPESKIRICFKYYVEQWKTNGARTYCYFRTRSAESSNISINELKEFYSDEDYYIIRGGGRGIKYLPHDMEKWLTFDATIIVPPTATYFEFGINSYYGTTIYIDDCFVGEVLEEPIHYIR